MGCKQKKLGEHMEKIKSKMGLNMNRLYKTIGEDYDLLQKICDEFGGEYLYISKQPSIEQRNQRIRDEYKRIQMLAPRARSNNIIYDLAKIYKLSMPTVYRIIFKNQNN